MRLSLAAALCAAAPLAFAQIFTDPDWKEVDAPPAPALRTEKLVALDLLPRTDLRWGVDPASVTLGSDRVVRYVVVARSTAGAVNAMYEGVRCSTGEVKVYARHVPEAGWKAVANSDWRPIHDAPFRHSLYIARNGACIGHAPNRSPSQIVRDLASGIDRQFQTDSAR